MKKYLTTKEAAQRLNYKGDAQVRKLIQRGKLKPEKLGHVWVIAEEELQEFIRNRKQRKKKAS
jgi:excisionase family DNA binding protein